MNRLALTLGVALVFCAMVPTSSMVHGDGRESEFEDVVDLLFSGSASERAWGAALLDSVPPAAYARILERLKLQGLQEVEETWYPEDHGGVLVEVALVEAVEQDSQIGAGSPGTDWHSAERGVLTELEGGGRARDSRLKRSQQCGCYRVAFSLSRSRSAYSVLWTPEGYVLDPSDPETCTLAGGVAVKAAALGRDVDGRPKFRLEVLEFRSFPCKGAQQLAVFRGEFRVDKTPNARAFACVPGPGSTGSRWMALVLVQSFGGK